MKISPNYYDTDWNALNLTKNYSTDWEEGANIVRDRIHGRYLAQIETLENHLDDEIWEYSGFLIIAVDCMVIETLNQFYLGIEDTNQVYSRRNRESFRDFFNRSQFFNAHFDDDRSFIFYDHIRNGLLHQAQTKKDTLINFREPEMVKQVNPTNIEDGIIVNRSLFHESLFNELNSYIEKLKTDETAHDTLREKSICKMSTIC
ncbi:MAG: hypothetical protein GFH25_541182n177 [Chloroflexi bacterium AL-N10]|nr:hypothetical protein [Chloroflexi bacterium AL-N10]NOK74398.1 hypothetical protein [Chloroflexi bacterium AL-N5]NOK88656.1 hypothetical protein [Chloroflexi bacterium AL-N15]